MAANPRGGHILNIFYVNLTSFRYCVAENCSYKWSKVVQRWKSRMVFLVEVSGRKLKPSQTRVIVWFFFGEEYGFLQNPSSRDCE